MITQIRKDLERATFRRLAPSDYVPMIRYRIHLGQNEAPRITYFCRADDQGGGGGASLLSAPEAQMDRATLLRRVGWRFESSRERLFSTV